MSNVILDSNIKPIKLRIKNSDDDFAKKSITLSMEVMELFVPWTIYNDSARTFSQYKAG